jgi:hypothetical protein
MGSTAALVSVASEYKDPNVPFVNENSSRKKGTKSENKNVCPKLEKKVSDAPKTKIRRSRKMKSR